MYWCSCKCVCHILHQVYKLTAHIAEKFETKDLHWAPDGKGLILFGKDQFCCAFEVIEGDETV